MGKHTATTKRLSLLYSAQHLVHAESPHLVVECDNRARKSVLDEI